jgi:hypothetical protein
MEATALYRIAGREGRANRLSRSVCGRKSCGPTASAQRGGGKCPARPGVPSQPPPRDVRPEAGDGARLTAGSENVPSRRSFFANRWLSGQARRRERPAIGRPARRRQRAAAVARWRGTCEKGIQGLVRPAQGQAAGQLGVESRPFRKPAARQGLRRGGWRGPVGATFLLGNIGPSGVLPQSHMESKGLVR